MQKSNFIIWIVLCLSLLMYSSHGLALSRGDILIRGGTSLISPKSNNGPIVNIDDKTNLTTSITYMLRHDVGVELLLGLPFKHSIRDKALGTNLKIVEGTHLPPTISLNKYFVHNDLIRSYLGLGLNHTFFLDDDSIGPLSGAKVNLSSSSGLAFQAGLDYKIRDNLFINVEIRKIYIDTKVNITDIDKTDLSLHLPSSLNFKSSIDPIVIALNFVWTL